MSRLKILLFGPFQVSLNDVDVTGFKSQKVRGLLAYLAVEAERPQSRDTLATLLWPDWSTQEARSHLRYALYDLRKTIFDQEANPHFLHITRETVQFNLASDHFLDTAAFIKATHEDTSQRMDLSVLEQAVTLYRSDFLEGFTILDSQPFEDWMLQKREQYHRSLVDLLGRLADCYEARGDFKTALTFAHRRVELEPWQEEGHRQVMRLLTFAGQRGAALMHFQRYQKYLMAELGVEPTEESHTLFLQIQDNSPELQPPVPEALAQRGTQEIGDCPYRGLAAFREQDAPFFFGRKSYIDNLAAGLRNRSPVVLIGSSGSGKSSLVYAGLLPRLRENQSWIVIDFRPGAQPFQNLSQALIPWLEPDSSESRRLTEANRLQEALTGAHVSLTSVLDRILEENPKAKHVLLFADQFEEVYTLCAESKIRRRFLDEILSIIPIRSEPDGLRHVCLLTLRADFMGQALEYRPFAGTLQEASNMLGPMSLPELHAAVEKPAELQGAAFEDLLIERILEDVGNQPGRLPLLEFALTLLWEEMEAGTLTHAAYEKIDRVDGALTRYAEQVYLELEPDEQEAAQQIFLQLIQPGSLIEDTRRVAKREDMRTENWPLVQYLADKRLVVTNRDPQGFETVEIVHEALIQRWDRLKRWIDVNRAFRSWQENLRANIWQWETAGRDEGGLLRGVPLAQADHWYIERQDDMSELEKQFIQASVAQREHVEHEREQQQKQELQKAQALVSTERRARRIFAALAVVLTMAVIITLVLVGLATSERRQAIEAYSLSLAASAQQALTNQDSGTALVLAITANQIENPPREAQRVLMDIAYAPGARSRSKIGALFPGVNGSATSLSINQNGKTAVLGTTDGKMVVWDLLTSEALHVLDGHVGRINDVAISPNGEQALSAGDDGQVILWDLRTGGAIYHLGSDAGGHTGIVRTVAFSPNGGLAVSGGLAAGSITNPGELILWDLESGRELRRLTGHINGVIASQFSPDGRLILSSSGDMEIIIESEQVSGEVETNDLLLWETASGKVVTKFENLEQDVHTLAISPDGKRALLGSYYENSISILNLNSGELLGELVGHRDAVRSVSFLPNGQSALSASDDDSLILWDLIRMEPLAILKSGDSDQLALGLFMEGSQALSVTRDGDLYTWDLQDAAVIKKFGMHGDPIFDVDYSPDGSQALSCSGSAAPDAPVNDASLRLWEVQSGNLLHTMQQPGTVNFQCAISPDGKKALSGGDDRIVRLWDLESGRLIHQMVGHNDWVISMAFSPDGKKALTGSKDGSLIYWDLELGEAIRTLFSAPNDNWAVAISPDGKRALSDAAEGGAIYWDLKSGGEINRLVWQTPDYPGVSGVAFMPDGGSAVTGGNDGNVVIWDMATGTVIRQLTRHDDIRTRVEISPDGKTMLTSGMDGVLRLWDLGSGDLVREFGYSGVAVVFDIAISPDGKTAISGSVDQMITQWDLEIRSLEESMDWISENRYVRELTCQERERYQIEPLCPAE